MISAISSYHISIENDSNEPLEQIRTRSSILLSNGKQYFKEYSEQLHIHGTPTKFLQPNHRIAVFPAQRYSPLTREEAKRCLVELILGVANALKSIHSAPLHIAHLDVWLDNICFDDEILIDPDRICKSSHMAYEVSEKYDGMIYQPRLSIDSSTS